MSNKSHPHDIIAWTKQRLDELDATIAAVEKSAENLKNNARAESNVSRALCGNPGRR